MRLLLTLLSLPAAALNVETRAPVAPVELNLAAPAGRVAEGPSLGAELSRFQALDLSAALRPLAPASALAGLEAQAPLLTVPMAIQAQAADPSQAPGAQASLSRLTESIAKDQTAGGARTQAVSGQFFDSFLKLPESQAIPEAGNAVEISREITEPPQILRDRGIQGVVTVYGSARIPSPAEARTLYETTIKTYGRKPKSPEGRAALKSARQALKNSSYYEFARRFGELVARGGQGKIALVTGGGPGIMEAANRGAFEAGGPSVGYNIKLPHEQHENPYITPGLSYDFENFASRKMNLRHGAVAMVYFPGGFGTMDELFEVLTLMQTGKIPKRPIVLVGEKAYWDEVLDFRSFSKMGLIAADDLKLFRFAETPEAAWAIVRGSR